MNIKLKARLSAYSIVDTGIKEDHVCLPAESVTNEQIDTLFKQNSTNTNSNHDALTAFIDSLFEGDTNV